jgi:hypothetical protein
VATNKNNNGAWRLFVRPARAGFPRALFIFDATGKRKVARIDANGGFNWGERLRHARLMRAAPLMYSALVELRNRRVLTPGAAPGVRASKTGAMRGALDALLAADDASEPLVLDE